MSNKEEIRKELEGLSPFLANIPKKEPYKAPPGYLHTMATEVAEKVRSPIKVHKVNLWERMVPLFFKVAVMAVIAVGVVIIWQQFIQPGPVQPQEQYSGITQDDVLEYFDDDVLIEYAFAKGIVADKKNNGNRNLEEFISDIENELLLEEL